MTIGAKEMLIAFGDRSTGCEEMKLLKKQISEKDGAGSVLLRAEEPEDMWHIYNLILAGDSVKTTTVRKVRGA
jgi:stalled ribosome rescue protein Dom34